MTKLGYFPPPQAQVSSGPRIRYDQGNPFAMSHFFAEVADAFQHHRPDRASATVRVSTDVVRKRLGRDAFW
jgi:hypothetical protein